MGPVGLAASNLDNGATSPTKFGDSNDSER
jgi:hypothetical protein